MKQLSRHFVSVLALAAISVGAGACSNEANNCALNSNCVPPDAGNGGTSGAGGNAAGGLGGNSIGGTSATSACSPACSGAKPACNETTQTCVECVADGNCSGSKPACNTGNNTCVQCMKDGNCPGGTPLCDTSSNICVQCKSNSDCTSTSSSLCRAGTCSPCAQDADCSQIAGKNACKTGTCVQCVVANESACSGNSCNPTTNICTTTPRNSVDICHSCIADSECIGGNASDGGTAAARCVQMTFGSASQIHGNYCLQRVSSGCTNPYKVPISAASLSGAPAEDYCGINEAATTCEAVLDLIASKACAADNSCGGGAGGICKTVGVDANRCTIPCDSAAQCLASAPGNLCTPPTTPYCH